MPPENRTSWLPVVRVARVRRPDPARHRRGPAQEGAVGGGILGGQRRQRLAALQHRPQDQPLGLLAVRAPRGLGLVALQPGLHGGVVVARVERTALARGTEAPLRAVEVLRQRDAFPRLHIRGWRRHQRAGALGELGVRGEEGFHLARAGGAQPRHGRPPAPAARHAHRQRGQRVDACGLQRGGGARGQPGVHPIGDERLRRGQGAQRLYGLGHGAGVGGVAAVLHGEGLLQVCPVARACQALQPATDAPEHAAR